MATAVAHRLLTEFSPTTRICVYGPVEDVTELHQAGALYAASAADLAARSQVVVAVVADLDELEQSLTGPSGLEAGVHSPTTLVISAIMDPGSLLAIAARLFVTTAGLLHLVEGPMCGSETDADAGRLKIAIGADDPAYAKVLPVLRVLGRCTHVGELGTAQRAIALGP